MLYYGQNRKRKGGATFWLPKGTYEKGHAMHSKEECYKESSAQAVSATKSTNV